MYYIVYQVFVIHPGNIEKKIRRVKNVYDYDHLKSVIESARGGPNRMLVQDVTLFKKWPNGKKIGSLSVKMQDIVQAKFVKGSRSLFYKTSFAEQSFKEINFLPKSFHFEMPAPIDEPRGVSASKKKTIIQKLCPQFSSVVDRTTFWKNLPESAISADLSEHLE